MLKWVGLVGCVVIMAAWGVSTVWAFSWTWPEGAGIRQCGLFYGFISFASLQGPAAPTSMMQGWEVERISTDDVPANGISAHGLVIRGLIPRSPGILRRPGGSNALFIPLWMPLILFAIPTAILWYRDRRPPTGHCQTCAYNLTGNVTGVCPECGETI
ncbi:MAG: hypothetical protein JSV19_02800 [Phycisphaerales bacterium]|nr:MAG: hypothetical protein JSV19_02800 [Phycisphaerales bacterium]